MQLKKELQSLLPKKLSFSENFSKVFPKADELFDHEFKDDEDEISYGEISEITIPCTQTLFKELNDRNIPEKLKFFSGRNSGRNELKFYAIKNVDMLNESNEKFLDYLSSDFPREVLSKSKMKIHRKSGNIYYNNRNMRECLRVHDCSTKQKHL